MPLPNEALENPTLNAKPAERLGYLGMALFVGSLLMTPMDKADAATFKVTNTNDNGAGSLRDAIDLANNAPGVDTITFDKAVTGSIELYSGELYIGEAVTIQGPGQDVLAIDAQGNHRIIYMHTDDTANPVSISGLTLTNGYTSGNGGAIFSTHSHLAITNCTISSNDAADTGGGIMFYGYYDGGQMNLTVTDSTFENNNAQGRDGGGIYAEDGLVSIINSTFSNNRAGDDGGAIGADDLYQLDITDSTFLYNDSYGTNFRGGGGAINIVNMRGPATISGSTISENYAAHRGGAITFEHVQTSEPIVISKSYIEGNVSRYDGGGLWSGEGNVTISDSTISDNYARYFGGGIFFDSDYEFYALTVSNSTLSYNRTDDDDGGAVYAEDGLLTFTGCTFLYNRADDDGGAIGGDDVTLLAISDCEFTDNDSDGGNPRGGGGAIWMKQFRGGATIQDSAFIDNYAFRKGGALSFEFFGGNLAITDSTISDNFTFGNGGGIYQSYYGSGASTGLNITNSTISNNFAYNDGGAIDLRIATAPTVITGSLISDNFARFDGGGIYFYRLNDNCPLTITNSVIHSNRGVYNGGGIAGRRLGYYSGLTLTNCTVSSNRTYDYDGGGLAIASSSIYSPVTVDRCRFVDNIADEDGGGIFFDAGNNGLLKISNTTIDGNEAYDEGGGIFFYCDNTGLADQALQISNSTISNNSSYRFGGGINFGSDGPGFRLTNTTVSGNSSVYPGGGMFLYFYEQDENCFIHNCTFTNNYSEGPGGGIFFLADYYRADLEIVSSIIAGNDTGSFGRDIFMPDSDAFLFTAYSLIGNGVAQVSNYYVGPGNIFYVSPYLYELANNGGPTKTHKLSISSLAIDAGVNAAGTIFDQRGSGFPRNVGGLVDIGAFELGADVELPNEEQFFGFGPDSDGDGFSDDAEEAAGTNPNDPADTPLGKFLSDESQFDALSILKTQVTLNFAKPLSDTVKLTGRIQLADGTALEGIDVLLDIAGNSVAFTLDAKGTAVAPTGKIKFKAPKGGVSTFGLAMKGNFQAAFAANADMQNETTSKVGEGKIVRVAMALNEIGVFHADAVLSYKATQGKSGKAK